MPVVVTTALVSGLILVILLVVLAMNNSTSGKNNFRNNQMLNPTPTPNNETAADVAFKYTDEHGNKDIEKLYRDNKLTAQDLDFWNMYDDQKTVIGGSNSVDSDSSSASPSASSTPSPAVADESSGELLTGVKENTLDFTNIRIVNSKMEYSVNNEKISTLGVDVSEKNGIVDFNALKNDGVDFVMLKVGSRGYDSGVITPDPNFERNIKAASEAGLGIGLYFSSRAVTLDEAVSEAQFCVDNVGTYSVKYPIGFMYEGEIFDSARTDNLEKEDRTKMAQAFLSAIESRGFVPVIYGTSDYILKDIDPSEILKKYDVLLSDYDAVPSFPYRYVMWKYSSNTVISGSENPTSYIISFIDYAHR